MTDENEPGTTSDETLGEGGVKALKAERDARKQLERQLREANERITSFERRDLINEVTSAKGLDARFAERLKGSTKEELEADADALAEMLKPDTEQGGGTIPLGRPQERLRGGGDPTVTADDSAAALADRIVNS